MALQTKDLMIGDWLQFASENKKCTVVGVKCDVRYLEEEAIITVMDDSGHWFDKELECLQPIPLTPEILEKNGFRKYPYPNIEKHHQWILCVGSTIKLWCCRLYDDADDGWMIDIDAYCHSCRIKIKYLHEMQHALKLCGIEKQIEL